MAARANSFLGRFLVAAFTAYGLACFTAGTGVIAWGPGSKNPLAYLSAWILFGLICAPFILPGSLLLGLLLAAWQPGGGRSWLVLLGGELVAGTGVSWLLQATGFFDWDQGPKGAEITRTVVLFSRTTVYCISAAVVAACGAAVAVKRTKNYLAAHAAGGGAEAV